MENPQKLQHSLWFKDEAYGLPLVLLSTLLLAIASHITIPLEPVPVTLQTLIVPFIGITLGSRLGALTIVCYLIEGFVGLPVFQGAFIHGATLGYLAGFLPAVYISGYLAERGYAKSHLAVIYIGLISTAVIWLFGISGLKLLLNLSWSTAINVGIKPFILADSLKIIFLAGVVPSLLKTIPAKPTA